MKNRRRTLHVYVAGADPVKVFQQFRETVHVCYSMSDDCVFYFFVDVSSEFLNIFTRSHYRT